MHVMGGLNLTSIYISTLVIEWRPSMGLGSPNRKGKQFSIKVGETSCNQLVRSESHVRSMHYTPIESQVQPVCPLPMGHLVSPTIYICIIMLVIWIIHHCPAPNYHHQYYLKLKLSDQSDRSSSIHNKTQLVVENEGRGGIWVRSWISGNDVGGGRLSRLSSLGDGPRPNESASDVHTPLHPSGAGRRSDFPLPCLQLSLVSTSTTFPPFYINN